MVSSGSFILSRSGNDRLLAWIVGGLAVISGAVVGFIIFFLLYESFPMISKRGILPFLSDPSWHPSEGFYNLLPMLWGTLLTTAGAVILATPLGILSAVFCHFYAPKPVAVWYRKLVELLAGIPSVVYGFWGLVVLVPLIRRIQPPGASLLAGILILTFMILPTIALIAEAGFANVPREYLRGAAALGISRWRTVTDVVFPHAKSALFTGTVLAAVRALGETMAVLMICGNVVQTPTSLFDPVRTLTANIALEMAYAMRDHRAALFVSGLLLTGLTIMLLLGTGVIRREKKHG